MLQLPLQVPQAPLPVRHAQFGLQAKGRVPKRRITTEFVLQAEGEQATGVRGRMFRLLQAVEEARMFQGQDSPLLLQAGEGGEGEGEGVDRTTTKSRHPFYRGLW